MTADSAIAQGRDAAESLMVDACTIARPSTTHTTDPVTGEVVYTGTTLYSGKCRVQMLNGTRGDQEVDAGERMFVEQVAIVSVPVAVTGLRPGDVVTVTSSQLDADLTNRNYKVRDIAHKSFLTARRLICEEVTG